MISIVASTYCSFHSLWEQCRTQLQYTALNWTQNIQETRRFPAQNLDLDSTVSSHFHPTLWSLLRKLLHSIADVNSCVCLKALLPEGPYLLTEFSNRFCAFKGVEIMLMWRWDNYFNYAYWFYCQPATRVNQKTVEHRAIHYHQRAHSYLRNDRLMPSKSTPLAKRTQHRYRSNS